MLRACLESLQSRLQRVRVEVIVVDNASTDGAAEMVARDFPRVVLVSNRENRGFARASNQAARAARGRYLFFLNNDTVAPPGALRELVAYMRAHPEVGLLGPRLVRPRACNSAGSTQMSWRRKPTVAALLHRNSLVRWTGLCRAAYRRYRAREMTPESPQAVEVLLGAALLARRSQFWECGGWDEEYTFGAEDVDLCTRIGRRYAVVHHPGVEIVHHGRASSRQRIDYVYLNTIVGVTRSLRKGGASRWSMLLYKAAVTLDAPLQWLQHAVRYLFRRGLGRTAAAHRSRQGLQGVTHLLTRGLPALWRA
jgi:GT2 family glycosyltransferase